MAKILVADDVEDVGLILSERLRRGGHEVVCAADGNIAVNMLEQSKFDLAILDIRMPGRDGFDVCAWIRNSPVHKLMPVVLMSAFSEEQSRWKKSAANLFLAKPFDGYQLLDVVKRLLDAPGSAAQQEAG